MDYYIYAADVYCPVCIQKIARELRKNGRAPKNIIDETTYESDQYPKGPFSDEESDTPEHCASGSKCLDPTYIDGKRYGQFFENPLTTAGVQYIREATDGPVKEFWLNFYRDYL